jgi:hypothetical protein
MAERTLLEMPRLEERVRAAARLVPRKDVQWRCLATRSRAQFSPRSQWMIPLNSPTHECFAVELIPCDADHPGAIPLRKEELPEQIRTDAHVLYDLWYEQLPVDIIAEVSA